MGFESGAEGEEERAREGRGERREKGGEAATASAAAVELLTSIHHCVTKNELERERERERGKGGGCLVHTGCPFLPMLLREIERLDRTEPSRGELFQPSRSKGDDRCLDWDGSKAMINSERYWILWGTKNIIRTDASGDSFLRHPGQDGPPPPSRSS